ncbi:HupE/UreJ family protein [Paenibacillus sp.]|uniref:HupE/UreJ family protein n=1 Tax=Paenibacillus sp. TaxID=58172 RepID=UPI002811147F|nr:HupE/UreJ family protein [Paenibacillus sp.]
MRAGIGAARALVSDGIAVTGDGTLRSGEIEVAAFAERAKTRMIRIDIRYAFDEPVERYMIQYGLLFDTHPDHRNFASIRVGDHSIDQVINASNTILQIGGANASASASDGTHAASSWTAALGTYVGMGMEHIWGGLDHMLFVLALLLNVRGWKPLAATITAFTLGHSVTLVLSALELASLSPFVAEPLIALSILYVAAENLLRDKPTRSRLQVTALFGLVHGFGFAEILHGALSGNIALPLVSFNLGVEIGQLAVVAAALPILWAARRYAGRTAWPRYASGAVGAFGLYWFIERIIENIG